MKNKKINKEINKINSYSDFIDYITLKAIKNIVNYSNHTEEDIYKFYSLDYLTYRVASGFMFDYVEQYNDHLWLRKQLKNHYTGTIRTIEYDIIHIIAIRDFKKKELIQQSRECFLHDLGVTEEDI